ncbi:MAG: hypothetical protein ACR2N2_07320 [Acidimicrobiia bacterium]
MPRPDKQISPGRLDGEASSMRSYSWTKHDAEPGTSEIEIAVDDRTPTQPQSEPVSKYEARGTAAHIVYDDTEPVQTPRVRYEEEWSMDRSIDGRTYRRSDSMTVVEVPI